MLRIFKYLKPFTLNLLFAIGLLFLQPVRKVTHKDPLRFDE